MTESKRIKTGGRQKGTPNRMTKELRIKLKNLIFNEIDFLESNINKLDIKERLEYCIKILPYILPKIENVHYSENEPFDVRDYI